MTLRHRQRVQPMAVAVFLLASACASKAPATLSPAGVKIWQANEAVVAIGTLQDAAIALNAAQRCEDTGPCVPLLSDRNTKYVVDAVTVALNTIRAVPEGWKATTNAALDEINKQLDEAGKGKLRAYIEAARTIINSILTAPSQPAPFTPAIENN